MTDDMDLHWIREALKKPGKTQVGLAKELGVDPSQISRLLAGKREIKAREISKIERYFGDSALENRPEESQHVKRITADPRETGLPFPVELPAFQQFPKDLPVYGISVGGTRGDFTLNGTTIDYVRRPPGLVNVPRAFGLYIQGESMSPWKEHGALIYIHPGRPVSPGDYVVIELKPEQDGDRPECLVKRLRQRTASKIILEQYTPPDDRIVIDARRVRHVYKVLTQDELFGV